MSLVKVNRKTTKNSGMSVKSREDLAGIFEILGSKARLKILKIITEEEKCVNFLSKKLKLSQPTVSYHLKLLLNAGLVNQYKTAQWVRYKLNKKKLAQLMTNFFSMYGILPRKRGKKSSLSEK